jgi:hypothetical protein
VFTKSTGGKQVSERKMTVSRVYQPSRGIEHVASIRLTGRWLEHLGFEIGDRFVVRESPGRIELLAKRMHGGDALPGKEV